MNLIELFIAALVNFQNRSKPFTVKEVLESINRWHLLSDAAKRAFGKLVWRLVREGKIGLKRMNDGSLDAATYLLI